MLRQAIEFSHDLDIIIRATPANAARVAAAVERIAGVRPDTDLVLGRDFQQYIDPATGTEIDVHLRLIAIPDYEMALRCAGPVEGFDPEVSVLELPALYASKRTDRPRDAVHRRAIEDRLRRLVLDSRIEVDDIVLACCLDPEIAGLPGVSSRLEKVAASTHQPLLQARLTAFDLHVEAVRANPHLHDAVRAALGLDAGLRAKLVSHPARLAAFLSRLPLELPAAGYHVRVRH
ncbi:MAG TPA: hypothetical protein VMT03_09665 [Polyangia bacterium]|nr:hypothetical protein [Polyangia bacterium]